MPTRHRGAPRGFTRRRKRPCETHARIRHRHACHAADPMLVQAGFGAAFLARVPFAAARFAFASSARLSAQLFFVAATIRFLPSSLIRRFGGSDPASDSAWDCPLIAAHLFFWASAIRRRDAAETLRLSFGASAAGCRLFSILRSSAILESICFCVSNPAIAAVIISCDTFVSCVTRSPRVNSNLIVHPRPTQVCTSGLLSRLADCRVQTWKKDYI